MKKILYGVALLALLAAMGCGNSTIRSAEIYVKQNDNDNAKRVIEEGMPGLPDGSVKAEAYSMLAQITSDEINALNIHAKKTTDAKDLDEFFNKRMEKIARFNDEIANSLKNDKSFQGRLDTLRENLWIEYFNNGVTPFNEKKWTEAIRSFQLAWALDSVGHPNAGGLIGQAMLQQPSKEDEAIGWLKRGIANEANGKPDITSRFNIANYYYTNSQWQNAIEFYDQILSLKPPSDTSSAKRNDFDKKQNIAVANKAICLDQLGKKDEASAAYAEALKRQPNNTVLWFNLGQRYFESAMNDSLKSAQEKYTKAEEAFEKVLDIDSTDIDSKYLLGITLYQEDKFVEAEKILREYVKAKPEKKEAWLSLRGAVANQIAALTEKGDKKGMAELKKKFDELDKYIHEKGWGGE